MLKLVRILNRSTNVPDLERVPKSMFSKNVYKGAAVEKTEDGWDSSVYYPQYITANTPKEEDKYVYCYKVTPDMVFLTECECYDTCEVGGTVGLINTNGFSDAVDVNEEGSARIVELIPNSRYIYIKFDLRRE